MKKSFDVSWRPATLALILLLGLGGCGLDEVELPAGFDGPSELALSLNLTAVPDVVTADGFSTVSIQATMRNQNGQPVAGRDIFFAIADSSFTFADIGTLSSTVARTNGQGIAQVIYTPPARTDFTANGNVIIAARPIGTDATAALYRTVRVELRSAEPRLFPPSSDNKLPTCRFVVEAPDGFRVNRAILFQTTSADSDGFIVRYLWDFGDGTQEDSPDTAKVYKIAGVYTVTHVVTDNNGGQAGCTATLFIDP